MKRRGRGAGSLLGIVLAAMVAVLSGSAALAAESTPASSPVASPAAGGGIAAATQWLIAQQGTDGSFLGFSGQPDAGTTVDALIALAAAQHAGVDAGGAVDKAVGYLGSGDVALVYAQTGVGQAAKLVLALVAAGVDPTDFGHVTPILIVEHGLNDETGLYGGGFFDHALAMLALKATGGEIPAAALDTIQHGQAPSGGWSFDGSADDANADSNTTALVLQALAAAGEANGEVAARGVAYLHSTIGDGGAAYNTAEGSLPDANSTALAIQGLLAVGEDVSGLSAALATFQNADGSFFYQASAPAPNLLATVQAIPAEAGVVLPITPASASRYAPLLAFTAPVSLAA